MDGHVCARKAGLNSFNELFCQVVGTGEIFFTPNFEMKINKALLTQFSGP